MNCEHEHTCLNAPTKCFRCNNASLLKVKGQKGLRKTAGLIADHNFKKSNADNSWEDLEQQVVDKLNNIPTIAEARRARASGALWFEKGDIVDTILHPECKERKGSELKTGEKSMSIKREWLEKAAEECQFEDKTMCLPFRFKGDKNIYCIFRNDDIVTLITTMKAYMLDNELKEMEIAKLKSMLERGKQNG